MNIPVLDADGPPSNEIVGYLSRLDGDDLFAVALWKLPEGHSLGTPEANRASDENYLQSAGSATAMTIELRASTGSAGGQYGVGRGSHSRGETPDTHIVFGRHTVSVFSDEVFTADEAAPIYRHYFETGAVPDGLTLRPLELGL
ncbi:hypothetical protein [Frondihabitans sp. PAMC 28766]|uniref:hypothetical protein n=1 Tax=Frondihabitans sp. PAMC 28766 TaxID=1795630 RepID=UPI0012FF8BF2|nr:hypothetical protein [Frondihabitans sp. PAMC 28766]